jgi:hypothetical protein
MLESRALRGAVAQLGERRVRNAKVEGSIPFRSTNPLFLDDPKWSPRRSRTQENRRFWLYRLGRSVRLTH